MLSEDFPSYLTSVPHYLWVVSSVLSRNLFILMGKKLLTFRKTGVLVRHAPRLQFQKARMFLLLLLKDAHKVAHYFSIDLNIILASFKMGIEMSFCFRGVLWKSPGRHLKPFCRSILSTTKTYKITSSVFTLCNGQRALKKALTILQTMKTILIVALHYVYTIFPLIYFHILQHIHKHP